MATVYVRVIDIEPAARRMIGLVATTSDDQLLLPTPCPDRRVGDLIDHVGVFAVRFLESARKDTGDRSVPPPEPSLANLEVGWRQRVSEDLQALAVAWAEADAWVGLTYAGGLEMPADVAGLVALDELVVHGWDLAVSTGQPYEPAAHEIDAATSFVTSFEAPRDGTLFGPIVPIADSGSQLDHLLGLTGRDPGWQPPA